MARRQNRGVVAGLVAVTVLAWAYVGYLALGAPSARGLGTELLTPQVRAWTGVDILLLFAMWAVMMVAMMLPSASPMILLFEEVSRRNRERGRRVVSTWFFVFGYLLVWGAFAEAATLSQWGLRSAAFLVAEGGGTVVPLVGAALLVGAGVYQWSPLKQACLSSCRTPLGFLLSEWREGRRGALVMGLRHGEFCLGCCWLLMGLLFVLGVMNILWIAALTALVLAEKVAPRGPWLGRVLGLVFVAWGAWLIFRIGI